MDDQSKEHVVRPDTGAVYEHDEEWKEAKAEFQLKWEADYRKNYTDYNTQITAYEQIEEECIKRNREKFNSLVC